VWKDTKLNTILRTHTLNSLGLFDQVESLGQPLLQAPMRLEIVSHSRSGLSWSGTGLPCVASAKRGNGSGDRNVDTFRSVGKPGRLAQNETARRAVASGKWPPASGCGSSRRHPRGVVTESTWTGGGLHGTTRSEWD